MKLVTPPDFQFEATIFSHGWCQLPPFAFQRDPGAQLSRIQQLADGTLVQFTLEADEAGSVTADCRS